MPLTFYDGPQFSGRSEALREFAWHAATAELGCYLHPMLEMNLSGLAETVAGELYLHGANQSRQSDRAGIGRSLSGDLQSAHTLRTLSGGETARLVLSCALARGPTRLALDCTLEQLDPKARKHVLENVLLPLSAKADIRIADNNGVDLAEVSDEHRQFEVEGAADLSGPLLKLAESLAGHSVQAPTIDLEEMSFRYPGSHEPIFDSASYSFEPGAAYLLKAPNGAGKSTLARLLLGVLAPDRGKIRVAGHDARRVARDRNLIFYAFQNPIIQMIANRTSSYLSTVERTAHERDTWLEGSIQIGAAEVLTGFGLESFADAEPFDLPFTVLKRLSIAASLVSRSPWLFFDEPALTSDASGRRALAAYFTALCKLGFGVIIVSHGTEFDGLPGARPITIRNGRLQGVQHGF
jgi:energy-coupling factor transport system ATP-binding protein